MKTNMWNEHFFVNLQFSFSVKMVSFSSGIQWNPPEGLMRLKMNKHDEIDIGNKS